MASMAVKRKVSFCESNSFRAIGESFSGGHLERNAPVCFSVAGEILQFIKRRLGKHNITRIRRVACDCTTPPLDWQGLTSTQILVKKMRSRIRGFSTVLPWFERAPGKTPWPQGINVQGYFKENLRMKTLI